jgi:hypothetical protein
MRESCAEVRETLIVARVKHLHLELRAISPWYFPTWDNMKSDGAR